MRRTDTIVIGGGQAGLAMSRCLSDRRIEHVVLERGRVAERWRSERWDSLRLLTPRWHARLPSFAYEGPDPDGFMTMPEVIGYLERYARASFVPVETETSVIDVSPIARGYRVVTDRGTWEAKRVVVGASASGVQIGDELARAGRRVALSVGRHTRLPRSYRGRDVIWWMDRLGVLDETTRSVRDLEAARRQPSLQLVGAPRSLDLGTLARAGVRILGRASAASGTSIAFGDDLRESIAASERRRARLLARIDAFVAASDLDRAFPRDEPDRLGAVRPASRVLDLARERIAVVVWATGFRRTYPWLRVPVLDPRGEILHADGVTPAPDLYVLGLRLLRTRKSTFLDGVGDDARALADHIARRREARAAA